MATATELLAQAKSQRQDPPPAVVDSYLGGHTAQDEENEPAIRKATEREAELADDPRIRHLQEQMAEQNKIIQSLLAKNASRDLNELAKEVGDVERQRARYKHYAMIRDKHDGRVTLQIHTHEILTRNTPVSVSLNGEEFRLKRGEPYNVPVAVLEILENARMRSQMNIVNAEGNVERVNIDQLSYPFTVLGYGREE